MISTDDRQSEVLAYSENGNFNMSDTIGNDLMKFHVDLIMAYEKHKKEMIERGTWQENEIIETTNNEFDELNSSISVFSDQVVSKASGSPGMPAKQPLIHGQVTKKP